MSFKIINYYILLLISFNLINTESYTGIAKYNSYQLSLTKCSFKDNEFEYYVAVGPHNFIDTYSCGLCVLIKNKQNFESIKVRIVDQCLGCKPNDITMDNASFAKIGDLDSGFLNVEWEFTTCDVEGTFEYNWIYPNHVNTLGLLFNNLAVPIKGVYYKMKDNYIGLKRLNFNLFGGMRLTEGDTINLRIISIFGEVIDEAIPIKANSKLSSQFQFKLTVTDPNNPFPLLSKPNRWNATRFK